MSSSIVEHAPVKNQFCPSWTQNLRARPRGLALARERLWTLAWDEKDCVHLFNAAGIRQAQMRTPAALASACCAEDGSAYAAVGLKGEVWWLAPDLSVRWEANIGHRATAAALDPFGQYLVVADSRSNLHYFDRHGRLLWKAQTQRPLQHLAFACAAPRIVGSADYGLVVCHHISGHCAWRDGLVANIGALAVSGDGRRLLLACFSEGIQRYDLSGNNKGRVHVSEGCRLLAASFDGLVLLTAGLSERLLLLNQKGAALAEHMLESPPLAIALGALAECALAALPDGRVLSFDLRAS